MKHICSDFTQGDSFYIKLRYLPAIDLADSVYTFALSKNELPSNNVLEVSYIVPESADATNGIVNIHITASDTIDLEPKKYYGSLKRVINGEVHTILRTGIDDTDYVTVHRKIY